MVKAVPRYKCDSGKGRGTPTDEADDRPAAGVCEPRTEDAGSDRSRGRRLFAVAVLYMDGALPGERLLGVAAPRRRQVLRGAPPAVAALPAARLSRVDARRDLSAASRSDCRRRASVAGGAWPAERTPAREWWLCWRGPPRAGTNGNGAESIYPEHPRSQEECPENPTSTWLVSTRLDTFGAGKDDAQALLTDHARRIGREVATEPPPPAHVDLSADVAPAVGVRHVDHLIILTRSPAAPFRRR